MIKQRIKNYLLKRLLCSVSVDDIIKSEKGKFYLGGTEVSDMDLKNLSQEARVIEKLNVWRIVNETLKAKAMEIGFSKSVTFEDLNTCKVMLYNLDIINSVIRSLASQK